MTATASPRPLVSRPMAIRPAGLVPLLASEALAAVVGFGVLVVMARTLGPGGFAAVESAAAVAAVLLVVVRGGVEQIVIREASRCPRLIRPLTETLIGLKLACAVVAFLGLAMLSGGRALPMVAGLILFPSALAADVGPRARRRLGPIAASQALRSCGLLVATLMLVRSPSDTLAAAGCVAIAETIAAIALGFVHTRDFGLPVPRFRRRVWLVLARRGLVASLTRLGRVLLYGVDLLALSAWCGPPNFGAYAASRRVAFAMLALGLIVPGAFAPSIASAWSRGAEPARRAIAAATSGLMNLALPAAIGLALTAEGWMTTLFGPEYRGSGLALAVVAARSPFLLAASLHQSSLVAIRREMTALRIVVAMLALAAIALLPAARSLGPIGVGMAMVGIEACGAAAGWVALHRRGISPPIPHVERWAIVGTLAMAATVLILRHRPAWQASTAGALAFSGVWLAGRGRARP